MAHPALPQRDHFSRHAKRRSKQRAISRAAIAAALDFGRILHLGNGARAHFFGRRELRALAIRRPKLAQRLRDYTRITVVIDNLSGKVITTYRCAHPRRLGRSTR